MASSKDKEQIIEPVPEPVPKVRKARKPIRRSNYNKRKECVEKKTTELSILCGVDVCTIVIGPDGEVDTWPDRTAVNRIIKRFKDCTYDGPKRRRVQHGDNGDDVNVDKEQKRGKKVYEILEGLDKLRDSQRREMLKQVDSKLETLTKRLESYEQQRMRLFGQDIVTYIEKEKRDDDRKNSTTVEPEDEKIEPVSAIDNSNMECSTSCNSSQSGSTTHVGSG